MKYEVDYYNEIARDFIKYLEVNLQEPEKYNVRPLIGEIGSALKTLIVNGYPANKPLRNFSKEVHKLHLDITILVENKENKLFELIIIEVKKVQKLGLSELSQLIGYCLVSKRKFGMLVNIDEGISENFRIILDSDKDLTDIRRILDNGEIHHQFGVMTYNSSTNRFEYKNVGTLRSIPDLAKKIENVLSA